MCILFFSCTFKKIENRVIIKGNVKNIPCKKVYLTDAHNWDVFLDSSDYKNDTFLFELKKNTFEPFLASICFINNEGKIQDLLYENYILSTKSKKYGNSAFVLDKGVTKISGIFLSDTDITSDKLNIIGSKQNEPYFATQFSDFGWININNKLERENIISRYKDLIKRYPYSCYFMSMLYDYRTLYSKEEMLDLLALFNNEAQSFNYSEKFSSYFKEIPVPGKPLHNYRLQDSLDQFKSIISDSTSLNIVIFWASWCGPCRKEIPRLKEIYSAFKNRNIRMVSISIDDNKAMWKSALLQEDMPWEQLIIDSLSSDKIKSSYNFSTIPVLVFTNNKSLEIGRFSGYETGKKDEYTPFIENYLKEIHN